MSKLGASLPPSIDCGGVLRWYTSRKLALVSEQKTLLVLVFLFFLASLMGEHLSASLQGTDFPDFYCAARIVVEGRGHDLYNLALQRHCQERYAGGMGTFYIHPPFEAVLYLAVAWLPLKRAYLLWSLLNLGFLIVGARRLAKEALPAWDWRLLLAASLTFAPVLLCLLQGQDSILFLLLVILAFTALRRERDFAAGCWLGLGLFKFQLVLPMALVLVSTRKKDVTKFATAFSLMVLALTGLSGAISGWPVFITYPTFLIHLLAQASSGVAPQDMANFHGLAYLCFHRTESVGTTGAVLILSGAALISALAVWKQQARGAAPSSLFSSQCQFDFAFAHTVMFALLVCYYLNPHDLSLLLLPIALLLHDAFTRTARPPGFAKWISAGLLAILFLSPLHLLALQARVYGYMGIPLLALFLTSRPGSLRKTRFSGDPMDPVKHVRNLNS